MSMMGWSTPLEREEPVLESRPVIIETEWVERNRRPGRSAAATFDARDVWQK
jgi:hypothetical protein